MNPTKNITDKACKLCVTFGNLESTHLTYPEGKYLLNIDQKITVSKNGSLSSIIQKCVNVI